MKDIFKQMVKIARCLSGIHTWGEWYEPLESERMDGSDINEKWEERVCKVCRKVEQRDT